jgi:hypothetical protein
VASLQGLYSFSNGDCDWLPVVGGIACINEALEDGVHLRTASQGVWVCRVSFIRHEQSPPLGGASPQGPMGASVGQRSAEQRFVFDPRTFRHRSHAQPGLCLPLAGVGQPHFNAEIRNPTDARLDGALSG